MSCEARKFGKTKLSMVDFAARDSVTNRLQSLYNTNKLRRWGLILLAFAVSLLAGSSFLLYDSPWTPLVIGGVVAVAGIGVLWLQKPVWALYVAICIITIPEGILPSLVNMVLNRFTLVVALALWLLSILRQRRQLVWTTTTLLMLAFLVWSMITLLWAPYLDLGVEKIIQYTLRLSLFLVLVINEINSIKSINGLMNTLAFSNWILIICGIVTILLQGFQPDTSLQVLNVNRNAIGEYLLITMPGVLWQVMQVPEYRRKPIMVLSIIYVLIVLILTVLTGSRGGFIAIILTLLAFWVWKPTRPWGKVGLVILVLAVISTPLIFSTVIRRFVQAEGGILGGRGPLWQAGFTLIMDNPLTGVGIGNAPRTILPYLAMIIDTKNLTERSLHNPVLQVWAETGLIGLIFYLSVLVSTVWIFFKQYARHKREGSRLGESYYALIFGVFLGMLATWIKGGGMEDAPTYFLILGLMLVPSCLKTDNEDGIVQESPQIG